MEPHLYRAERALGGRRRRNVRVRNYTGRTDRRLRLGPPPPPPPDSASPPLETKGSKTSLKTRGPRGFLRIRQIQQTGRDRPRRSDPDLSDIFKAPGRMPGKGRYSVKIRGNVTNRKLTRGGKGHIFRGGLSDFFFPASLSRPKAKEGKGAGMEGTKLFGRGQGPSPPAAAGLTVFKGRGRTKPSKKPAPPKGNGEGNRPLYLRRAQRRGRSTGGRQARGSAGLRPRPVNRRQPGHPRGTKLLLGARPPSTRGDCAGLGGAGQDFQESQIFSGGGTDPPLFQNPRAIRARNRDVIGCL